MRLQRAGFQESYKSIHPVNKCELYTYTGHFDSCIFIVGSVLKSEIPTMAVVGCIGLTCKAGKWSDYNK